MVKLIKFGTKLHNYAHITLPCKIANDATYHLPRSEDNLSLREKRFYTHEHVLHGQCYNDTCTKYS